MVSIPLNTATTNVVLPSNTTSLGNISGEPWVYAGYSLPLRALTSLSATFSDLRDLTQLGDDWDGEGSPSPSEEVLRSAEQLLVDAAARFLNQPSNVAPTFVAPVPGGGIYLEWRTQQRDLQLYVHPGDRLGYLSIDRSGSQPVYTEMSNAPAQQLLDQLALVLST